MNIYFCQFLKDKDSGEHKIFADYPNSIKVERFGTGKFVMGKPSEEEYTAAAIGWKCLQDAILSGTYDLVVADELNVAASLGLVKLDEIVTMIANRPAHTELIITGRGAAEEIIALADLVTEMKEIKHYFNKGVQARRGIEK
jgi:cob(I)alamin adenosyltransferase